MNDFTFSFFDTEVTDTTTVAYWPIILLDPAAFAAMPVEKAWSRMAQQFEAEGQATEGNEDVIGCAELAHAIQLFVPIQLVEKWSPLPTFARILGEPSDIRISPRFPKTVIATWPSPVPRGEGSTAEDRRIRAWETRVHEIAVHAFKFDRPFAVVAFAGFDFEGRALSRAVRTALNRAEFKIDDRSPV